MICAAWRVFWKFIWQLSLDQWFDRKKRVFFESVRKTQQVYVLHQKGVHSKNNLLRDLSVYVIQKFNGYEVSRQKLKRQQKFFFEPIDIVYDLIKENENIRCYFASDLALAYRTYYSWKVRGKGIISNLGAKELNYCHYFFYQKRYIA